MFTDLSKSPYWSMSRLYTLCLGVDVYVDVPASVFIDAWRKCRSVGARYRIAIYPTIDTYSSHRHYILSCDDRAAYCNGFHLMFG